MIDAQNPFFEKYNTPHGTVPFDKIKTEHYEPAIREGIRQHIAEINAITDNPEVPTFDNTLLAYETVSSPYSATCAAQRPMMICKYWLRK